MTPIKYTEAELAWIKENCKSPRRQAHQVFCAIFKRSDVNLIHYKALCKRNGWLTGRTGCYEKGSIPLNKGEKMPYNANSAKTRFKKGQLPHNTHYLGHERATKKDGYIEISIAETNPHTGYERRYVLKHKYLWEQKNEKLPIGMCLKCLDGNRKNTDPANWEAIPRGVLPFLNGRYSGHNYDEMPTEIKPAVLTLAKLKYAKTMTLKKGRATANDRGDMK